MDYSLEWDKIGLRRPSEPIERSSHDGVYHQLGKCDGPETLCGGGFVAIARQATWQASVRADTTGHVHTINQTRLPARPLVMAVR